MGIFSSSYETYVGTYISSFSDTGKFVSSKQKGVISGISRNEDVGEHVLENLVSGPAFKAKKAHKFSGEPFIENGVETEYVFGRPNDTLFYKDGSIGAIRTLLSDYLTDTYGNDILIGYTYYGELNYFHRFYECLADIGYNFNTKELTGISAIKNSKVTLVNGAIKVNTDGVTGQLLNSFDELIALNTPVSLETTLSSTISGEIYYQWTVTTTTVANVNTDDPTDVYTQTTTEDKGTVDFTTVISDATTTSQDTAVRVTVVQRDPPTSYPLSKTTVTNNITITTRTAVKHIYVASTKAFTIEVTTDVTRTGTVTTKVERYNHETVALPGFSEFTKTDLEKQYLLAFIYKVPETIEDEDALAATFSYRIGSRLIEELEDVTKSVYKFPGTYMPRCYLRWEFINGNDATLLNTTKYTHSKKLAKKMGFKYDKIIEKAFAYDTPEKTVGRTADELALLRSSFITYLVRAKSEDPIDTKYLYHHFKKWHTNIGADTTNVEWEAFKTALVRDDFEENVLVIEDKRFKSTIGIQNIYKYEGTGTFPIDKAGVYDRPSKKGEYGCKHGTFSIVESRQGGSKGHTFTQVFTYNYNLYRFQKADSTDVGGAKYDEYRVIGLETKYYVTGDHFAMSGFVDQSEETKDILYVPVDYDIVKNFSLFEEEEIMYKSLHFVANQSQTIKLEWYQSGFWEFVFTAAAFVAAAFGYVEGFEFVAAITAIAGASMVWAMEILLAALIDMLTAAIAAYVFVRVAGEDLAMLAAMVMIAYGMGNSLGLQLPYADELLSYSNSIFKAVNKEISGTINSLKGEYESLLKESSSVLEDLQKSIDEASPKVSELTKELIRETPEEFLNKSYIGNIGTKVFDIQRNYVDISLRLPYKPTYSEV